MARGRNTRRASARRTTSKKTDTRLKLSLIENARDFMDATVEKAKSTKPLAWKYALLNLAAALELLIKSILEKEHWSLLFQDVNTASKEALLQGDFKSVDFETGMLRLENVVKIKLPTRDKSYLTSIRQLRNRINHFHVDIKIEQVKSLVARGILIFLDLYKSPPLKDEYDERYEFHLNQELNKFERYVGLKMAKLKKELDSSHRPAAPFSLCDTCFQDALVFSNGHETASCLYCGVEGDPLDLSGVLPEGSGGPCPVCEDGELQFVLYNNEDGEFICLKCGFRSDYGYNTECYECGQTFWSEDHFPICSDCMAYKMSKD